MILKCCECPSCLFEYLPAKTVSKRGEKTVWVRGVGNEKKRVTAMLLGDSLCTAYAPILVFKSSPATSETRQQKNQQNRHGFGPHVWRVVQALQCEFGLHIHGNKSVWWNAAFDRVPQALLC